MTVLKRIGLSLCIASVMLLVFSCGEEDSPYSSVSVEQIGVDDVEGTFSNTAVTNQTDFENKILAPLMNDMMASLSVSSLSGSVSTKAVGTRALITVFQDSATTDDTINLATATDVFTSGTVTQAGAYSVLLQQDDTNPMVISGEIDASSKVTISDAQSITNYSDNSFYFDGKANLEAVADFSTNVTGDSEATAAVTVDLDYGIALSCALAIDVNDTYLLDGDDSAGALVTIDFKMVHSNHKKYVAADYTSDPSADLETDMINDCLPSSAALNISVYDNDRTLVFTTSYDMDEIMTLAGSLD